MICTVKNKIIINKFENNNNNTLFTLATSRNDKNSLKHVRETKTIKKKRNNYLYCARRCQVTFLGFIGRSCVGIIGSVPFLRLYCSLVRSDFCHCSQLWAPQSVIRNLFLVEKMQRRATRFILKNSSNLPGNDRSVKLKLLPLNYWLQCLDLVFFFIELHGYI